MHSDQRDGWVGPERNRTTRIFNHGFLMGLFMMLSELSPGQKSLFDGVVRGLFTGEIARFIRPLINSSNQALANDSGPL